MKQRRSNTDIIAVHEALGVWYQMFFSGAEALIRHGSVRFKNLGVELLLTRGQIEDQRYELNISSDFDIESYVTSALSDAGYSPNHPWLKNTLLAEIEYMLDILEVLIEPDWIPGDLEETDGESLDRHIASRVKVAVWRRDMTVC